jgi:hypothetical protein
MTLSAVAAIGWRAGAFLQGFFVAAEPSGLSECIHIMYGRMFVVYLSVVVDLRLVAAAGRAKWHSHDECHNCCVTTKISL